MYAVLIVNISSDEIRKLHLPYEYELHVNFQLVRAIDSIILIVRML